MTWFQAAALAVALFGPAAWAWILRPFAPGLAVHLAAQVGLAGLGHKLIKGIPLGGVW